MKTRPYSWIYTAVLVLVGISIALTGGVAAQSTGYVDIAASDLSGSGTAADPYVITNASELQAMEDNVTANYILGEDIDASGTANWNNGAGFDPIDDLGGTFDGAGHTIESITIDRPNEGNVGLFLENGYRSQGGQVYNVTISDADVTGDFNVGILAGSNSEESKVTNVDVNGTVTANTNVGGIVGINQGRLLNSSSDVSVSGSGAAGGIAASSQGSVENVSVSGNIDGKNSVGGIIGSNKGIISQASSTAEINGTEFIGGLVGYNYNTTLLSFASGSVSGSETVGGLTGANSGNVTRTYATGSVNADKKVGGLIGQSFRSGSIIAESFAVGVVTGQSEVGGAIGSSFDTTIKNVYWDTETVGQQTSAGGTALTTTEMTGDAAETNMAEFAFGSIWKTQPDGYPILITLSSEGDSGEDESNQENNTGFVDVEANDLAGSGTSDDPYIITNASELQAIEDDLNAHYKLGNDINASGTAGWNNQKGFVPINRFNGTLNGTGNVINGLTIDRPSESGGGLINFLEEEGEIVKLHLTSVNLNSGRDTGGLIGGSNDGVIENSSVDGTITSTGNDIGGLVAYNNGTVTESTFSGEVTGAFRVGGIAGNNEINGIIRNSSSAGEVTANNNNVGGIAGANGGLIRNSAATTAVQGNLTNGFNAGGLVGVNGKTDTDGIIESSYATGNVDGDSYVGGLVGQNFNGSIKNSYAAGRVSGDSAGGLVGRNDGTIIGSYWDTDATGQAASAGSATGLSTAEMTGATAQNSMSALDFDTVWNTQPGDYPILMHQADDTTDESSSVQVQVSNISLTPQTVDSGSESTHRLTFETRNISADGSEDEFNITFPDKVELVSYSNVEIDEKSSGVDMTANTLEFSVNPIGGGSTQISGDLNVTLSATT